MHASGRQGSVLACTGCFDTDVAKFRVSREPYIYAVVFYIVLNYSVIYTQYIYYILFLYRKVKWMDKLSPRNNHVSVLSLTVAKLSCQLRQTPACPWAHGTYGSTISLRNMLHGLMLQACP